jgi:hypothetical protein
MLAIRRDAAAADEYRNAVIKLSRPLSVVLAHAVELTTRPEQSG